MAIRMMVGVDRLFEPGVEIITDYPGAEIFRVRHHWDCPHYKDQSWENCKTISPDCHKECSHYAPLLMETIYKGRVLSLRERNFHDDSDFYATVWDDATSAPVSVEYGTTRAWTYPNGASVDATPEIQAKYAEHCRQCALKAAIENDKEAAAIPAAGKVCRVVRGRKIKVGETVTVLRIGEPRKYSLSRWAVAVIEALVKVNGTQVWTNIENLEVLNPEQYYTPEAELQARM
jgi:hypothetical protein